MTWRGVDVSNLQGVIDWPTVAASGISWAAIKVTEGTGYVDPMAERNLLGAHNAGLTTVPYHFARVDLGTNAVDEAAFFLAHCGSSPLVVLDMEMPETPGPDLSAWALAFLNHVQDAGKAVYIYSYPYYIQTRLQDPALTAFGLWLATYSASFIVPKPWSSVQMWQNGDNGLVPGINGRVDTDISYVDLSTIGQPPAPQPAPTPQPTPEPPTPPAAPPSYRLTASQWLQSTPGTNNAVPGAPQVPKGAAIVCIGNPVVVTDGAENKSKWQRIGYGHQGRLWEGFVLSRFVKAV